MHAPKKYFVVSGTYNAEAYIGKCIQSVNDQVSEGFDIHHIIIDDGSTDRTAAEIKKHSGPRQVVITHEKNLGPIQSQLDGFAKARELGSDYDIIAQLDGDDWFSRPDALTIVNRTYLSTEAGATYGNYTSTAGVPSCCRIPDWENLRKDLKRNGWPFSHLRTFRMGYTRYLKDSELRDEDGDYYVSAQDVALYLPIAEMAGLDKVVFIQTPIVTYNMHNPLRDGSIRYFDQARCANECYQLPPRKHVDLTEGISHV